MNNRLFNEQEIDLLDLLLRLVEQWRGLLISGLIFALMFSGSMYMKYGTRDSGIINKITLTESTNVEDVYQQICTALSQYADYMLAKNTYDNSIINRSDYKNLLSVTLKYQIESLEGGEDLGSGNSDVFTLMNLYSSIMGDGDFTESMLAEANRFWNDFNPASLGEILSITASQDTSAESRKIGLLTITCIIPNSADIHELENTMTDSLNAYHNKISPLAGQHTVKLIILTNKKINNDSLTSTHNNSYSTLINAKNTYDKTVAGLADSDKKLVDKIISENEGSYDIATYISSLDKKLEEAKKQAQEADITPPQAVNQPENATFSIKYFALGFILGCFIYAGVYFTYFVLIRLVRDEHVLERASGMRNFGGVYDYPYTGSFQRFLHDKKVYSFRTRKGKSAEAINEDIVSKLIYLKDNNATVISVGKLSKRVQTFIDSQGQYLADHKIDVKTFNIEDDVSAVRDSQFIDMNNVIILLLGNRSKWVNVRDLYYKLCEYGINIIGSEYLEN
ncbi:MAG: hypothetical protein IKO16_09420 [Lachnospiraceae bacterium]|nr:hypothetical protein [Lachnospiraceae bacterium]